MTEKAKRWPEAEFILEALSLMHTINIDAQYSQRGGGTSIGM